MADSLALNDTQRAAAHIGTRAGEYLIESFLGAGAMGEVYAGRHPEIGKRVAIKVLKSTVADGSEAAERFKREARVVNQIAHPNVIDVFAFGRLDDGRLYLVMDLVEGETLRAAVANGPLAIDQTLDILDQVADALDAAHAKGVVHRDLKPDNVMLSNGKIFVLDFGIAKLVATGDGTPPSLLTGQGAWIGTPSYMAPEQWSADGAGPASDRYALGVMAFELLSGKRPFDAGTLPQLMEQHFRAPVPALSTRGAVQARASFDPVLARAMAKDPAERYPTAKALVAALREVAGKRVRAPLRRPWLPAVLGVGVLGLGIAGVVIARGRPDGKPSASGLVAVTVRSNPPRATVLANGRLLGTTPLDVDLRAGEPLVLVVQKPGYTTVTKTVAPARGTVE
ncbi:MAG TPA: serine/threonine-protein kinase, partial [Kofleriaceae bacterium]|nr:serine/threonine-protein kinase [Kofleriaceae bacterium]